MAAPVWPEDLPVRFAREGYEEGIGDPRLAQKMQTGRSTMRRQTRRAVRPVSASVYLDTAQRARLERWWDEDLRGGVRAFTVRDQARDGVPLLVAVGGGSAVPLLAAPGLPLLVSAHWLCRIAEGAITYRYLGGPHWQASFALEILP